MPFGESVDVLTAGAVTDPYSGETREDWGTATQVTVTTSWPLEPRPSGEPVQDARNAVTSGFTLYFDHWPDITARNRIRVRDTVYDVLGDPAEWRWPNGSVAGSVVQVGRTEG
jgi:hypothetical protein